MGYKKVGFGKGKLVGFGGKVQDGETVRETAVRELREELGGQAEDLRFFGVYTLRQHRQTEQLFLFVAQQFTLTQIDTYEIADVKPFPIQHLPPDLWPPNQQMIDDYLALKDTDWCPQLFT